MMTHEEIESAIERLNLIEPSDYVGSEASVAKVVWGFMGGAVSGEELRDVLVDLLKQADPDTHMEVPVDVDGVPIHIGDEMERGSKRGRVVALMLSNYPKNWNGGRLHWGVLLEGEQAHTALDNYFHHYHKPTVEGVLTEMLEKAVGFSYAHTTVALNTIAEYAEKIREAMA